MKKYIIALIALSSIYACKQDEYYLYNDVKRLQFGPDITRIYQTNYNLADTVKRQTFYYTPEKQTDTVYFDIYAIGGKTDHDRTFTLKQIEREGENSAIPGVHYQAFTDAKSKELYTIKAGAVHKRIPIVLFKDASLKENTYILHFEIQEDENFKLGEKSNIWRRLETTDRLSKPDAWASTIQTQLLGTYSVRKHQFLIETTGDKWDQEFISGISLAELDYYKAIMTMAVLNYNKTNTESLKDENGLEIKFP